MDTIHPLTIFRERHDPPLSQEALAKLLGVTRPTVTRWEAGARLPKPKHLPKIAEITGIPWRRLRPDLAAAMRRPEPV